MSGFLLMGREGAREGERGRGREVGREGREGGWDGGGGGGGGRGKGTEGGLLKQSSVNSFCTMVVRHSVKDGSHQG